MAELTKTITEAIGAPIETVIMAPKVSVLQKGFKHKNPSDWEITAQEDGSIIAYCSKNADTFAGSIAEFNNNLKD